MQLPERLPGLYCSTGRTMCTGSPSVKKLRRLSGGGAILDVASPEELDEIMAEFPLGPFSHVEI